jgi:hypothetical protein
MLDVTNLDTLVKLTQLIGIPIGIGVYGINKRNERLEREYGTYDALDNKYIDYLKLCLANPDLDVADTPRRDMAELSPEQRHRELVIFSILISIMERAYLMYKDKSSRIRRDQWTGWDAYIRDWSGRTNFTTVLPTLTQEFDGGFVKYLDSVMRTAR